MSGRKDFERKDFFNRVQQEIEKVEELCEHLTTSLSMMADCAEEAELTDAEARELMLTYINVRSRLDHRVIGHFEQSSIINKVDSM